MNFLFEIIGVSAVGQQGYPRYKLKLQFRSKIGKSKDEHVCVEDL